MNLSKQQLQEVARHMGHELSVHKDFYRLQEDTIELAKISKLLLLVEQGKIHRFQGMSLDDITMEGNLFHSKFLQPYVVYLIFNLPT